MGGINGISISGILENLLVTMETTGLSPYQISTLAGSVCAKRCPQRLQIAVNFVHAYTREAVLEIRPPSNLNVVTSTYNA